MAKKATSPRVRDDQVRALLQQYQCPVPFHVVRTRFLGNIASPGVDAAPLQVVKALWGGELPPFDTLDAANELIGALMMGLWNQLTRHQERSAPFRLVRVEVPTSREGLARLARLRRDEVEGFVDGLFGDEQHLELPERARAALATLGELRAALAAAYDLAEDATKPAEPTEIAITLGHFRQLTKVIEHEMHEAVLSCTRARRQFLAMHPASRPVVH